MNENTSSRKALSMGLLCAGTVMLIAALWMDITKKYVKLGSFELRGVNILFLKNLHQQVTILIHRKGKMK